MRLVYFFSLCFGILWVHLGLTSAQEEFLDEIECYTCYDEAVNTTCSHPTEQDLKSLGQIKCKRGGCIKWAYYQNHRLMLYRTCSMQININIHLADVCKKEGYGNGYLCMCSTDFCNSSSKNKLGLSIWVLLLALQLLRSTP